MFILKISGSRGSLCFVKFSDTNIYVIRLVRVVILHTEGETEWLLKESARERVFMFLFSAETTKFSCICMSLLTISQS